jgi:hypothetical protein
MSVINLLLDDTLVRDIIPLLSCEELCRVLLLSKCVCKKGFLPHLPSSFVIEAVKSAFPLITNWPVDEKDPAFFIAIAYRYFTNKPCFSVATTGSIVMDVLRRGSCSSVIPLTTGTRLRKLMRSHAGREMMLRVISDLKADFEHYEDFCNDVIVRHLHLVAVVLEKDVRTAWAVICLPDEGFMISGFFVEY